MSKRKYIPLTVIAVRTTPEKKAEIAAAALRQGLNTVNAFMIVAANRMIEQERNENETKGI